MTDISLYDITFVVEDDDGNSKLYTTKMDYDHSFIASLVDMDDLEPIEGDVKNAETFSKDKVVCIKCGIPSGFPHLLHELPSQVAGKHKYACRNCYNEVNDLNAETFEAEKTGKMNLTMKELLVLILVNRDWEDNDWETDEEGGLTASFYHDDMDMKKMRGVLSSLVQKGIITAQENYVNRHKYTLVSVNDKYTTGVDDYEGSIDWDMFDCKDEMVSNMGYEKFIEWASTVPESIVKGIAESKRAESNNFNVEFNEWADQEMMSHGKDISFKDWAEDEGMKHGNTEITDWAQHEDESHDARYGAESLGYSYERKKRSGLLSEPFEGTSLDSGDWKGILTGFGIGLLGLFGYSKLRK